AIAIVAGLGPGLRKAMVAIAIVGFPLYTRLVRGAVLSLREREFVEAARALGASDPVILGRHVLPHLLSPVIVAFSLDVGAKILATAGLSFLGLGTQPPTADWGSMLATGRQFVILSPHVVLLPGLAIFVIVLALNLVGHGVWPRIVQAAFEASREFHALPLEEKLSLKLNDSNIGYLPVNQSMQRASTVHKATRPNFNESFFISHERAADHPDVVAGTPLRGRNRWPAGHAGMRAMMVAYFKTMEALGERMLPVLARSLGLPAGFFAPYFANEAHINLRFLHYPHQDSD